MDPLSAIGLASSVASFAVVATLIASWMSSWVKAGLDAPTELDSLVAEVTSTRAALGPLERYMYVRLGSLDDDSRKAVLTMMADLRSMEDELFTRMEWYLGDKPLSFWAMAGWPFRRNALQDIARRISTQKVTILALQVANLTQQTVKLVQTSTAQEQALNELLQIEHNPNPSIISADSEDNHTVGD